jgi:Ca-activated chloride channel family protein
MRAVLSILSLLLAFISVGIGQVKPPTDSGEVLRVETELVEVPFTVVDRNGKPLTNLSKNNFSVFEDGKLQNVEEFFAVNAPFEVALLLDTSGSTRADLELIRRAAREFILSLRPGDRVSITAFKTGIRDDRSISVPDNVIELTSDREKLRAAIDRVTTGNGTPYYDSLVEIAGKVFAGEAKDEFRGRRALVALTDGVDSTSLETYGDARALLAAKGLSAYFININTRDFFEDRLLGDCQIAMRFSQGQIRRYYASFGRGSKVEKVSDFCQLGEFEKLAISKQLYEVADLEMKELARVSGGRVFPAADLTDARLAFKQVADEIGTRYSLGYYPTNDKRDGKFRAIRVEIKGVTGAKVRAREGYTSPTN